MKFLIATVLLGIIIVTPTKAASNFDLSYAIGPSLSESGGVEDLGDPNFNTLLEFNYFFKPSHGIGFGLHNALDLDGSSKFPLIDDANISTIDIHYALRLIKGNFHFLIEPGFGWQTLYDQSSDIYGYYYYDDLSTALIVNYKLMARYILKEWDESGSVFAGAGISQIFSMDDDLNGRDISGNRLSMLIQVGVGW